MRDRLWAEAQRLRAQGQLDEAITAAEKMLAIERAALGAEHPEVAVSLEWLAKVYIERADFAAARKARQEVLALRGKLHGMKPWQVTDARLALADVERLAALSPDQRRRLAEANQLNQRIVELSAQGKYREALELAQKALTIRQQLLGEGHPDYAQSLNNLAALYRAMARMTGPSRSFARPRRSRRRPWGRSTPTMPRA